jgi:DNA-binding response OmpR family regulator
MELVLVDRTIDLRFFEVRHLDGRRVRLSTRESQVLRYFVEHRGRTISRDELGKIVWRHAPEVLSRAPDVMIARLRRRLEIDPADPRVLVTIFGEGYVLLADEADRPITLAFCSTARPAVYFGEVGVDPGRAAFVDRSGAITASMTATELELVRALLEADGAIVERDVLARRLGGCWRMVSDAVYRLRRKLERVPSAPRHLLGVRGIGYRLSSTEVNAGASFTTSEERLGNERRSA